MFGTMGFSELIIILVIVLIIFGAGRLPQIGEGLGKALKGFKKEVHEVPPPSDPNASQEPSVIQSAEQPAQPVQAAQGEADTHGGSAPTAAKPNAPYSPGPELTPGTTAALLYTAGPQAPQPPQPTGAEAGTAPKAATGPGQQLEPKPPIQAQPPAMEERMTQPPPAPRASYPALPANARPKPGAPRPSAVVNKAAVSRVQAQQAAMKQAAAQKRSPASPQDMQSLGEGLGEALRTFRQAAADVRGAVEPEMQTLRTEMDSAQKEIEQSVDAARQMPAVQEDPPSSSQA